MKSHDLPPLLDGTSFKGNMPKASSISCAICDLEFKNTTEYRKHLQAEHKGAKPFECPKCTKTFAHKNSLKRHTCDVESEQPPSKRRKRTFSALSDFATTIATTQSFAEWAVEYNKHRGEGDPPLSDGTITNIANCIRSSFDSLNLNWTDFHKFTDNVDDWLDGLYTSTIQPLTITNRLRYLLWYAKFQLSNGSTTPDIPEWLEAAVSSSQTTSTKSANDLVCIALLDPYSLVRIRDSVVTKLRERQRSVIDPFIQQYLRGDQGLDLVSFGIDELRCWIELAMRFVSVPMRMQCSINLVEPGVDSSEYVAKLVYKPTIGQYTRIIFQDKNGNTRQPTEVPLGRTITYYLGFYRIHCRPVQSAETVFQNRQGGKWTRASRDVKEYLRAKLSIEPDTIEPSGRFVHGTRHIGLATYALAVDFDSERMRNMAFLMRHTVAVSEKYYSIWLERSRNAKATQEFSEAMQLNQTQHEPDSDAKYVPTTLCEAPKLLKYSIGRDILSEHDGRISVESPFETRDASTQTGHMESADTLIITNSISDSTTLPVCKTCMSTYSVLGPLGQTRHRMFGRYFAQCTGCHGRRPHRHTVWYDEGYKPAIKSISQKPRNASAISSMSCWKTSM